MRALALLAVLLAKAPPASYVDAKAGFQLTVPKGWEQVTLPEQKALVTFANDATHQMLVISRIDGDTEAATRGEKQFFEAVERGVASQASGYKKVSARAHEVARGRKKIPAYDLWFTMEREGKRVTVGARFLFLPGHALSLVIDAPEKKHVKPARKILESFVPAPPPPAE